MTFDKVRSLQRKAALLLGAGMLLQTGGCDITGGLLSSILTTLITSLVAGAFNVSGGGFGF